MRAPRAGRAPARRSPRPPAASSGGVGRGPGVASERSTCSIAAAGTPRSTSVEAAVVDVEHERRAAPLLGGRAVGVVRRSGALLQDGLAQQPAGQEHDPLARREARRRRRAGRWTRAGRPRRGGRAPARAARPSQRLVASDVPVGERARRRGTTSRASSRPGSAGRRRGRGRATRCSATNRRVCALTGSVMSPPGGETAPRMVTDASSPPSVRTRPARS